MEEPSHQGARAKSHGKEPEAVATSPLQREEEKERDAEHRSHFTQLTARFFWKAQKKHPDNPLYYLSAIELNTWAKKVHEEAKALKDWEASCRELDEEMGEDWVPVSAEMPQDEQQGALDQFEVEEDFATVKITPGPKINGKKRKTVKLTPRVFTHGPA